jgi:hypothetical protein
MNTPFVTKLMAIFGLVVGIAGLALLIIPNSVQPTDFKVYSGPTGFSLIVLGGLLLFLSRMNHVKAFGVSMEDTPEQPAAPQPPQTPTPGMTQPPATPIPPPEAPK